MILSASFVPPPSPSDNRSGDNLAKLPLIDIFVFFRLSSLVNKELSCCCCCSFIGVVNRDEKLSVEKRFSKRCFFHIN